MYDFRGEAYVLQQARYNPSESESKRNDFAEGAYSQTSLHHRNVFLMVKAVAWCRSHRRLRSARETNSLRWANLTAGGGVSCTQGGRRLS